MKKISHNIAVIFAFLLSGIAGFGFYHYTHINKSPQMLDVQTIQTFHYPSLFVEQLKGDPHAGKKIFKEFCATCHGNPAKIDIQAPRISDKKAWQLRKQLGMTMLLKITTNGIGAMPARGGCFECSDQQLRETIDYLLENSAK